VWTLAWRNVWRKKGRSVITMSAVALVVILSLVYFAFGGAARNALYTSLTEANGQLQVRVAGYRDLREFGDLLMRDAGGVAAAVAARSDGGLVVEALDVLGLLEGNARSRGVALQGIDRPAELQAAYADGWLREGRLPTAGDVEGIVLSVGLARAIDVAMGDTVYVYAPGTEGYGAAGYTVIGLLDLPSGAHVAQLSLAAAQELAAPDAVTRLEVHLPSFVTMEDDAALPVLRARLAEALGGGYDVETWRQASPGMASYLDLLGPMQAIVNGIFFILAGLLVTNTVYLSVIERVREFGVIQALGARGRKIMAMVVAESLFLCLVGAGAGSAVGLAIVARMAQGFGFPAEIAAYVAEYGFPEVMYASLSPDQLVVTVVFTLAIAVLAAILPAFTATHLEPIEAIRYTA